MIAFRGQRNAELDQPLQGGGVAGLATPGAFAEFSAQGGMASDGRCKSVAASAKNRAR